MTAVTWQREAAGADKHINNMGCYPADLEKKVEIRIVTGNIRLGGGHME